MFTATLQMINGFINELQAGTAVVQPVVFSSLSEDKQPLTDDKDVHLTDDQCDCYTVILTLAIKMD